MSTLTKLLNFLPTYFNINPEKVAAFTIDYAPAIALMRYSVADDKIFARTFNSFYNDFEIALSEKTIQEVVDEINAVSGYTATIYSGVGNINAIRLVDIENSANATVYYHDYPLWGFFKSAAIELNTMAEAGQEIVRQLAIPASTGILSDYHGSFFGLKRNLGETDMAFNQRIVNSFRPKSNNVAMEIILQNHYGYYIRVFDLDFSEGTLMLMNDITTPVHNKSYPIRAVDSVAKEECVFGLMFPEGTISQWEEADFTALRELVYSIRPSACRPKLFWTDAPVFDVGDISFVTGTYFYTKYL